MEINPQQGAVLAAVGVGCLLTGGAGGYFIAKKRLEKQYRKAADLEIAGVKRHYAKKLEDAEGGVKLPGEATAVIAKGKSLVAQIIEAEDYGNPKREVVNEEIEVEQPFQTVSIFDRDEPQPDPDEVESFQNAERDPNVPYLIPIEEFMDDHESFDKITVTFYEGDEVLLDERDQVIPNVDEVVGEHNLQHFGRGSQDGNTLYVRNEKLRADFEVCRDEGTYTEYAFGVDVDATPDGPPRVRKMRPDE